MVGQLHDIKVVPAPVGLSRCAALQLQQALVLPLCLRIPGSLERATLGILLPPLVPQMHLQRCGPLPGDSGRQQGVCSVVADIISVCCSHYVASL